MNSNKDRKIVVLLFVFSMIFILLGGSFAYLRWSTSEEQKTSVTFTTTSGFSCSANGGVNLTSEDTSLAPSDCTNSKYAIQREIEVKTTINNEGKTIYMNMWLEVINLDSNLANSNNFKYAITNKSNDCTSGVIAGGTFTGLTEKSRVNLFEDQTYVESSTDTYYLYIWLDSTETDTSTMDETFEFKLAGECSDKEFTERFAVTNLASNYQIINATVVNKINNIVSYAITTDNVEPLGNENNEPILSPLMNKNNTNVSLINLNQWIEIPEEEQNKIYNFEYIVSEVGTYYLWFKDSADNIISNSIEINEIYTDKPMCTWGEFSQSVVASGETSNITLTCTGNMTGNTDLTIEDITLSSDYITLSNIEKNEINNGYSYTFTLIGKSGNGNVLLTLPSNILKNIYGNENDSVTSSAIIVENKVNITYIDGTGSTYTVSENIGSTFSNLPTPIRDGYIFLGWYTGENGTGTKITSDTIIPEEEAIYYGHWIDNIAPTGSVSTSISSSTVIATISASDSGSGVKSSYGWKMSTSSTCDSTVSFTTATTTTYNFNLSSTGTQYVCVRVEDNSGNVNYFKTVAVGSYYTYSTPSGYSTLTVPITGNYKLEVWGAQGGTINSTYPGGYGGYSTGEINLIKNETLYIYVGGQGKYVDNGFAEGGYNGGGSSSASYSTSNNFKYAGAGGGATHIAKTGGLLSSLSAYAKNHNSPILIVAGGGGGAGGWKGSASSVYFAGGSGGGETGVSGSSSRNSSSGGTQTSVGSGSATGGFGKGASSSSNGGGGGGYYGGGAAVYGSGSGGSGYIAHNSLKNKYMYCYKCTPSSVEASKTYNTTTNVSETAISNYVKSKNGYAKITFIGYGPTVNATMNSDNKIQVKTEYFANSIASYCVNNDATATSSCSWVTNTTSSFTTSTSYMNAGSYYVHVKDSAGNIYHSNVVYNTFSNTDFTFIPDNTNVTNPYVYKSDGTGWYLEFLTSGILTLNKSLVIDAFLLGGGGGGGYGLCNENCYGGAGGGGGYITTSTVNLSKGTYNIIIGAGGTGTNIRAAGNTGGTTSAFNLTANGGAGGGAGGAGGGSGTASGGRGAAVGNTAGGSAASGSAGAYAFGELNFVSSLGTDYKFGGGGGGAHARTASWVYASGSAGSGGASGGGAGGSDSGAGSNGKTNSGGGGGGGGANGVDIYAGGTGGSGIVIIRNAR